MSWHIGETVSKNTEAVMDTETDKTVADTKMITEQVLNSQKDVSGTHSFKLIHKYIAPVATSWKSESRNLCFVVKDKLLN